VSLIGLSPEQHPAVQYFSTYKTIQGITPPFLPKLKAITAITKNL
jgi:hypothetical protein